MMIKKILSGVLIIVLVVLVLKWTNREEPSEDQSQPKEIKQISTTSSIPSATNLDGSLELSGLAEKKENEVNYSFYVVNTQSNMKKLLFETTTGLDRAFSIPRNSWSSDNKYFFIEKNTSEGQNYYVFKSDGSVFADEKEYLDVNEYWNKKGSSQTIKDVSGWAGPDLLMVYTSNADGTDGSKYWFVVSSRKFSQISE